MDEVKPAKLSATTKEPNSTSQASGHSNSPDKPHKRATATEEESMRPADISAQREVNESPPNNSATPPIAKTVDEQRQQARDGQADQRTETDSDSEATENADKGTAKEATKVTEQLPQDPVEKEAENDEVNQDVDFKLACSFHGAEATEEGPGNGLEDAACQTVGNETVEESRLRDKPAQSNDESEKRPEESKKEFIEVLVDEALGNDRVELPKVEGDYSEEANTCKVHRGMSGRTITIESEHDKRRSERFSLW